MNTLAEFSQNEYTGGIQSEKELECEAVEDDGGDYDGSLGPMKWMVSIRV